MSSTTAEHRKHAPKFVRAAVITVSDSKFRGESTGDDSGSFILNALKNEGHEIAFYTIVPDVKAHIVEALEKASERYSPNVIVTAGGTGISPKDVTIEALEPLFEKKLDGFGEIFRSISYDRLGSTAFLSRATAGIYKNAVVFCLPGSPDAVKTGMELILREACHIVKHLKE
ncbi:MogA/MoaB family molybdenum cofactor biosynthesis protein [Candidatus Micrarchaeota archaeon]|nr:MogA/MoaB family molybdenum cofactor biosynthesis protein [Candidatus Micrarchaeota archaeon]